MWGPMSSEKRYLLEKNSVDPSHSIIWKQTSYPIGSKNLICWCSSPIHSVTFFIVQESVRRDGTVRARSLITFSENTKQNSTNQSTRTFLRRYWTLGKVRMLAGDSKHFE